MTVELKESHQTLLTAISRARHKNLAAETGRVRRRGAVILEKFPLPAAANKRPLHDRNIFSSPISRGLLRRENDIEASRGLCRRDTGAGGGAPKARNTSPTTTEHKSGRRSRVGPLFVVANRQFREPANAPEASQDHRGRLSAAPFDAEGSLGSRAPLQMSKKSLTITT
ncbi:hypothetical protein EVAR_52886_1 [Eumeta japonica]|uniref:Uncharacterized protein n=1 Tax=Eumeta variegata TaxID=151549 RepID=A0A4C1YM38_EUMVA|nr:hypothetical protein EVAR_52886_1 [Eumeta japonica]